MTVVTRSCLSSIALAIQTRLFSMPEQRLPTSRLFTAVKRQITALERDRPLQLDAEIARAMDPKDVDLTHKRLVMALIATRSQKSNKDHRTIRRIAEAIGAHDAATAIVALFQARYASLDVDAMNYAVDDEQHLFPAVSELIDRVQPDKLALPTALLLDHVDFVDRNRLVVFPEIQCPACVGAVRRMIERLRAVDEQALDDAVAWMRRRNPSGRLTRHVLQDEPQRPQHKSKSGARRRRDAGPSAD